MNWEEYLMNLRIRSCETLICGFPIHGKFVIPKIINWEDLLCLNLYQNQIPAFADPNQLSQPNLAGFGLQAQPTNSMYLVIYFLTEKSKKGFFLIKIKPFYV